MLPSPRKRWLTVKEVMAFFSAQDISITERTIERWCRQGKVIAHRRSLAPLSSRGDGVPWLVDLKSIKRMSDFGRELWEECVIGAVNSERL